MGNEKRNHEIFALRECGKSYSELGIQFRLSPCRIKQIYDKEKKRRESEQLHIDAINGDISYTFYDALIDVCETNSQATRIYRCLARSGIISEMETNNDSLDTYSDETLLDIINFGPLSLIFSRQANALYKEKLGL